MEEDNIKVSVIIPIYNTEKYLKECLESLLAQSLEEFEIICIDVGSTDNSVEIIKDYQIEESRIKLIVQMNQTTGAVRNNALKIAKGEYIIFLEDADFFDNHLLEVTYEKAKEQNADCVLFDAFQYDAKEDKPKEVNHYLKKDMIPSENSFNRMNCDGNLFMITDFTVETKLFKKEFLIDSNILFQDLSYRSDGYFILTALAKAEKIVAVKKRLINHCVNRKETIQNEKKECPYNFIDTFEAAYVKLNEWNIYKDVERGFINVFLSCCVTSVRAYRNNIIIMQIADRLKNSIIIKSGILEFENEYYQNLDHCNFVKSIIRSITWRENKKIQKKEFEIVHENEATDIIPKVSVIVPFYNVEKYLSKCLDSVINQTLKEIEIICINDGSTDTSLKIALDCAEKDSRIRVISQNNRGVSVARNVGIHIATGEYVYYLDGDDYLELDALEELYHRAKDDNLDIVYFDAVSFKSKNDKLENTLSDDYYIRKHDYSRVYTGLEYIEDLEKNNEYRVTPCLQMIKNNYLQKYNFKFYEGIIHEDNLYTFSTLIKAERVSHISKIYYHRRLHENSIVTSKYRFDHCYGYFITYLEMMKLLLTIKKLPLGQKRSLYDIEYRIYTNARDIFKKLDETEKYYYYSLEPELYYYFLSLIVNEANAIKGKEKANKEKSEIKAKLQKTYEEKSEINAKLKKTYEEKAKRGAQIEQLKKDKSIQKLQIKQLKEEKKQIQKKYDKLYNSKHNKVWRKIRKLISFFTSKDK
jgi:glycosyltransferase involved in cell wall biosynthesis